VDDEELARRGLEIRLQDSPDIEIVAQCANGRQALAAISEHAPDLMFLDIQMPGLSGLDVLASVPQESMPMVVRSMPSSRSHADSVVNTSMKGSPAEKPRNSIASTRGWR